LKPGRLPEIIPAVDVMAGRCVRLLRGRERRATGFGDPVAMAERYAAQGASWLHVVDLDGAFGRPGPGTALEAVRTITGRTGLRVQFGGGVRTLGLLSSALSAGASRVIVGTAALEQPEFLARAAGVLGSEVVLALDLRRGRPLLRGWVREAPLTLPEALALAKAAGVRRLLITDTSRDGTMSGIRASTYEPALDRGFDVQAAGGVASLADVRSLARLAPRGLGAVVIGSALLRGAFTLEEARLAADPFAGRASEGGKVLEG